MKEKKHQKPRKFEILARNQSENSHWSKQSSYIQKGRKSVDYAEIKSVHIGYSDKAIGMKGIQF